MQELNYSYICDKTFETLTDLDRSRRRCEECDLTVVNFDALTLAERIAVLKDAAVTGRRLCAASTTRGGSATIK